MRHGNAGSGQLVVAVLFEALKKFGTIDSSNKAQVTAWVTRRVREITGYSQPEPVDSKARAAGDN